MKWYQGSFGGIVDIPTVLGFGFSILVCNYILDFPRSSMGGYGWFLIILVGSVIAVVIRAIFNPEEG